MSLAGVENTINRSRFGSKQAPLPNIPIRGQRGLTRLKSFSSGKVHVRAAANRRLACVRPDYTQASDNTGFSRSGGARQARLEGGCRYSGELDDLPARVKSELPVRGKFGDAVHLRPGNPRGRARLVPQD